MNDDVDVDVDVDDHHHLHLLHHHHHHVPLNNNNNNNNNNSNSMVIIRDENEYCSVFPPINHENLQISSEPSSPSPSPSPSCSSSSTHHSSFSPSDSDASSSSLPPSNANGNVIRERGRGNFVAWMGMGITILRSKLFSVASSFRKRGVISSIGLPAGTVLISCWIFLRLWYWLIYIKTRRRTRSFTQNEIRLMNIIKDKDKVITQLLHQIAQMNEILIARHKALASKVVE